MPEIAEATLTVIFKDGQVAEFKLWPNGKMEPCATAGCSIEHWQHASFLMPYALTPLPRTECKDQSGQTIKPWG